MTSIPRVTSGATVDDVAAHLEVSGCVVVERLMDHALLDALDAELDTMPEITRSSGTVLSGFFTKRLNGVLEKLPSTRAFALHPLVLAVVDRMLSPYCARYRLNFDALMQVCPGESDQALHRDGYIYPFRTRPSRSPSPACGPRTGSPIRTAPPVWPPGARTGRTNALPSRRRCTAPPCHAAPC